MSRFVIAAAVAALLAWPAFAQRSAVDELITMLAEVDFLQGNFHQYHYNDNERLLSESTGYFKMLRPGHFLWEIQTPDSQLIVADPDYVWHHDRDLETVTRRPVDGTAALSPLQVLGGDDDLLRTQYEVEAAGPGTYVLRPLAIDPGFMELRVSFADGVLDSLQIADNLQQKITIVVTEVDSETPIELSEFDFTPPEGADLFVYDE